MATQLIIRNVIIGGRRTSLRLEQEFWDGFDEICRREEISKDELCAAVEEWRHHSTRTSAVRALIITYFLAAASVELPAGRLAGLNMFSRLGGRLDQAP